MFGVECFDTHDEPISHYTQWDINQTLKIVLYGMDDGYMKSAPYVHFANSQSYEALVVRSTLQGDNTIIVDIPNVLLQEPWPLLVYIYLNDSTDAKSQKTIVKLDIPVQKRVRPSDYEYVENIDRVTAETIKQEIYDDFMNDVRSRNLAYPQEQMLDAISMLLTDAKLSVDDAKRFYLIYPAWKRGVSYGVGDYVRYNGSLYLVVNDIDNASDAPDSSDCYKEVLNG